jgi:hypothetical protein
MDWRGGKKRKAGARGTGRVGGRGGGRGSGQAWVDSSGSPLDQYALHEPMGRDALRDSSVHEAEGLRGGDWAFIDAWAFPAPSVGVVSQYIGLKQVWEAHKDEIARAMSNLLRPVHIGKLLHPHHPALSHGVGASSSVGLFAGCEISAGSDIGYFCGHLISEEEMDTEGILRAHGRYAIEFDASHGGPARAGGDVARAPREIPVLVDASMHRNEFAFANDYRGSKAQPGWGRQPNIDMLTVSLGVGTGESECVWPCVLVRGE